VIRQSVVLNSGNDWEITERERVKRDAHACKQTDVIRISKTTREIFVWRSVNIHNVSCEVPDEEHARLNLNEMICCAIPRGRETCFSSMNESRDQRRALGHITPIISSQYGKLV
jgi:hypothetical protein